MSEVFDVFLCHNSSDKSAVRELADLLVLRGLRPWLDERELIPGRPWQDGLEIAISSSRSVAVLVGGDGQGPWQKAEIGAALSLAVERGLPLIPVLLPGVSAKPELPMFLRAYTWVDFREGFDAGGVERLEWGIRGQKPGNAGATSAPMVERRPWPKFWRTHKESLERWAILLGIVALAVGVFGDLLDLKGKWKAFWEAPPPQVVEPAPTAPVKQVLKGAFYDADSKKPLSGVKVWLPEQELGATTDAQGQFKLELKVAEDSRVKLRATLDGYKDVNEDPPVGTFNQWPMRKVK